MNWEVNVFNHADIELKDFRVARAFYAESDYFTDNTDNVAATLFASHPNRDRDLSKANVAIGNALNKAAHAQD